MKRSRLRLPSLCLCLAWFASTGAALNETDWRFRQGVPLPRGGVVRVAVPLETLDRTQADLRDLRLVGPDGAEVPFALVRPTRAPAQWVLPHRFEVSLADTSTVITVEAPASRAWEALSLQTTTPRFVKATRIEASEDGITWEVRAEGVPFFRQDGVEQTTFDPGKKPARWYRVTLDDRRQGRAVVTAARLRQPAEEAPEAEALPVEILRRDEYAGQTALTLALPAANLDVAHLQLEVPEPFFRRPVKVALPRVQGEEIHERVVSTDTLYRLDLGDGAAAENIRIQVGTLIPAREVRLLVEQGDSPPLRITGVTAVRAPWHVVFAAAGPGRFEFWSGNDLASAPRYDVSAFSSELRKIPPIPTNAQPISENAAYHRPDPLAGLPIESAPVAARQWSQRRGIDVATPGVQWLELDLVSLSRAADHLGDLRIVRDDRQLPYIIERTGVARAVDLPFASEPDAARPEVSRWRIQLPVPSARLSELILETSTPLFERHFDVYELRRSQNGETYRASLGGLGWKRLPSGSARSPALSLVRPQTDAIWLECHNGDNAPVSLTGVGGRHPVVRLLFRTDRAETLTLLSGNAQAAPPRYDLNLVAEALLRSEKNVATLSAAPAAAQAGGTFRAPTVLFWTALSLVVAGLLVLVAKLLPKPK